MNPSSFGTRILWGVIFGLIGFQNCSPVNFSNLQSEASEAKSSVPTEDIDFGPSNGDAYSGKVSRYILWSAPGECGVREIVEKSVIHHEESKYFQVKRDCDEIPPVEIDQTSISMIDDETISYSSEEYTLILPTSCQEIFDLGGGEANGMYYIDPDGPLGNEYISVYCDMDIISKGWTPWSKWSDCSASCGGGEQSRVRECRTGNCSGPDEEVKSCNDDPC